MNERDNQNPGSESDISKSQSEQQPISDQDKQQPNAEQSGDQAATGQDLSGQAAADQAGFGETATQQRSDTEGSSLDKQPVGEAESGFVGAEGGTDTSSELVEDEDEAPEGK